MLKVERGKSPDEAKSTNGPKPRVNAQVQEEHASNTQEISEDRSTKGQARQTERGAMKRRLVPDRQCGRTIPSFPPRLLHLIQPLTTQS